MTDQYAVFGNPINHSKSPTIHKFFAEQTNQDINYSKKEIPLGQFADAAKKFFDEGGKGLNITVPFKLDAFAFAEKNGSVSERAKLAGAVNTLKKLDDGNIFGDNTDGVGLVRDITQNLDWEIKGKNILILGAGGAASGVLNPLLDQGPFSIIIHNRTVSKAHDLVKRSPLEIRVYTQDENVARSGYDLIINCTSASLAGELPYLPGKVAKSSAACYDMMYGKDDTIFMQWAKKNGCQYVYDGLGMLVEQAAESFFIWRGIRPETQSVIEKVRSEL